MTREEMFEALGGVADRHVAAAVRFDPKEAYALPERSAEMDKRSTARRIAVTALAAALLLALGATAWAAGWLDSIFGQAARKINTNDASEDRIEAAAAAVYEAPQEPESRRLPAFDGSELTLKESYYDGQGLLLGVDLDAARQDPVVGYEPDTELLARLTAPSNTWQFYYSTEEDLERMRQDIEANHQGAADYADLMAQLDRQQALLAAGDPDDLDVCLETGYISREEYKDAMDRRSDRAAAAGLHYESAIWLDAFLERELTGEQYDALWDILERDGAACVVMWDVYVGDHMLVEGEDIAAMDTAMEAGAFVQAQAPAGDEGRLSADLPAQLQDLDQVHVQLKVKGGPAYYYMTLNGRACVLHEQEDQQLVSFTIPNSAK